MLSALELVGFKSFADKTRLEFPRGITVVVGPNGSGKSNIVDAIKWVLGEQSVKSLRGKEMADVIFNGSANRRALNAAESTLTFDNSQRRLAIDTPEVHITRRVYRSGEGEYLINRQPARLRDIRDLLAGTGMATEAYSIIEQGKVDVLLQASPRDRRLIFEEAAGISRFKAKKLEAQRRLERVEQNLLRLSDIVEEVDNRLRTVRTQAAKARRYKEYADRLQELRTQVGLADWRALTERLEAIEAEVAQLTRRGRQQRRPGREARSPGPGDGTGDRPVGRGHSLERIAQCPEPRTDRGLRSRDRPRAPAESRPGARNCPGPPPAHCHAAAGRQPRRSAPRDDRGPGRDRRRTSRRRRPRGRTGTRTHPNRPANSTPCGTKTSSVAPRHLEQLRAAAALGNQISVLESRSRGGRHDLSAGRCPSGRTGRAANPPARRAGPTARNSPSWRAKARSANRRSTRLRARLAERRQEYARVQQELSTLREKHSGASERAALLDELERRLEGVSSGVKEMLVKARQSSAGPYRQIRGLVADLLNVHLDTAALVEAALGEAAQYVVLAGSKELVEELQRESGRPAGRVGFVRLDVLPPVTGAEAIDLTDQPGVVGRADQFVETAPEFAVLAKRLLGKTWIVETLADGLAIAETVGRGLTFVSRTCDVVGADGTLLVGPRQAATGLISRRSELRSLRQQVADLAAKIERRGGEVAALADDIASSDKQASRLAAEARELAQRLAEQRLASGAAEERHVQLERQAAAVEAELTDAAAEHSTATTTLTAARDRQQATAQAVTELEARLQAADARIGELEQHRQRASRETNAARVDLAKIEQQVEHLRTQQSQLQRDQQERGKALEDSRAQLATAAERARQAERNILTAESAVAELFLRKRRC